MNDQHKRVFDLCFLAAISPVVVPAFMASAAAVLLDSGRPIFFRQKRVGRHGQNFEILKFRSMVVDAAEKGPAVTAKGDARVTRVGKILRKTKLDELPQLINVLRGEMSFIGPRPEVPIYVDMNDSRWQKVLSVRPGLSDLSSLVYRDEEALLDGVKDIPTVYQNALLPEKLRLSIEGIEHSSLGYDLKLIIDTLYIVLTNASYRIDDVRRAQNAIEEHQKESDL